MAPLIMLIFQSFEGFGEVGDDVACYETLHAEVSCGNVAGESVEVHSQLACFALFVASCEEGEDYSREDVAAACGSHTCVACGVEDYLSVGHAEC